MKYGDRVRIVCGKYADKIGIITQMYDLGQKKKEYIVRLGDRFLICYDDDIVKLETKIEKTEDKNNTKDIDDLYEIIKRVWCESNVSNGLSDKDLIEIFGTQYIDDILLNKTATEFVTAIKEWEEKKKEVLRVGDVLIHTYLDRAYVISYIDNDVVHLICETGTVDVYAKEGIKTYFNKVDTNILANLNSILKVVELQK